MAHLQDRARFPIYVKFLMAIAVAMAVLILLALTPYSPSWLTRAFSSQFENACELRIIDTLKAPSSYRRITSSIKKSKVPLATLVAFNRDNFPGALGTTSGAQRQVVEKNGGAIKLQTIIQYDAANSYGSLIRSAAICEIVTFSRYRTFSKYDFLLNGTSYMARLKDMLDD